jgi:hypothetical protein
VALAMRDELGACLFALGRASAPEGPSRRTGTLSGLGSASAAASSRPELNVVLHPGHKCPLCEDDVLYLISMEPLTARELELIDERFAEPAELGLSLPTPLELRNRALAALGLGHGSEASGEPSRASSFCARIPGIGSWPATVPVAPRISESGPRLVLSPARESGGCVTEPSRVRETLASMRASAGGSSVVADNDFATVVPSCAASGRAMTLQPASAVVTGANEAAAQPPPAIRFRSLASGSRQGRTPTTSQARQQRMQAQRIDDVARGGANLASMRTRARAVALFTPGEAAGEKAEGARARSPTKAATLLDAAAANAARRRPMRKSSLAVYAMLRRNEVRFGSPIEPNARLQAENDRLPPAAILASGQLHALRRQMMGHIVLVTQSLDDIVIFVSGMRASHLRHRPIVIICPIAAMGSRDAFIEWAEIDHFRGVFLLQGRAETPTLEDLNNAHVRYAECVVVVSSKSLRNAEKSSEQIDLENLITTLSVRAVVGDRVKCVVQLQSGNLVHNFGSPVIAEQPARAQPSAFASIKRFGPRAGASGLPPNPSRRSSEAASSAPAAHPSTSIGKQMLDAAQCLSSDTAASTPGLCSRALAWLSGLGAWLGLGSGRDALEQRRRLLYLDYTLTPHFMSGMLVVTSVVGHLLCQVGGLGARECGGARARARARRARSSGAKSQPSPSRPARPRCVRARGRPRSLQSLRALSAVVTRRPSSTRRACRWSTRCSPTTSTPRRSSRLQCRANSCARARARAKVKATLRPRARTPARVRARRPHGTRRRPHTRSRARLAPPLRVSRVPQAPGGRRRAARHLRRALPLFARRARRPRARTVSL